MASTSKVIELDEQHGAPKASGVDVWDPEGKHYIDCLSAYSAVNQGHCHKRIIEVLCDQAKRLTISSRAFHNDMFGKYAEKITKLFGYDMILPMNTGAEAVETAIKLARKWGYKKKNIEKNEAIVLACKDNFHGRTIAVISMSTDPQSRNEFGPYLPRVGPICPSTNKIIEYGKITDLEEVLNIHGPQVAAFLIEPIQGEAGIIIPPVDYLKECYNLCKKHNVLFIADEIQTGLGRTGKLLACEWDSVRPDIVILGKALSGGVYPVSAVLADSHIMTCIQAGEHGSTYGGNPLACAIAVEALNVLTEEKLSENSQIVGEYFRNRLTNIKSSVIKEIRGRGLMNAVEIDNSKMPNGKKAWDLCLLMAKNGVLAKPTHDTIIRLTPPLCISKEQIDFCVNAIEKSIKELLD